MSRIQPASVSELRDAVCQHARVVIVGGGTKRTVDDRDGVTLLSTRGLTAVVDYVPAECVITALAGTPLADINEVLAEQGHYLPFDPPFAGSGATIGGAVAMGLSGSGRHRYGGIRDFVIGVQVVDGNGRAIRSGGRVVKNAAGFLLHYAMVGSAGRFGVLTELTLKVFPAPEARHTLRVACVDVDSAAATARLVEATDADCEAIDFDHRGVLWVRLAGRTRSLMARVARVQDALAAARLAPTAETSADVFDLHGVCVKVAGALTAWPAIAPCVSAARFFCAGELAWLWSDDLAPLGTALRESRLTGVIVGGPQGGERTGPVIPSEFEERVRRVLDPEHRFSAPPHSAH